MHQALDQDDPTDARSGPAVHEVVAMNHDCEVLWRRPDIDAVLGVTDRGVLTRDTSEWQLRSFADGAVIARSQTGGEGWTIGAPRATTDSHAHVPRQRRLASTDDHGTDEQEGERDRQLNAGPSPEPASGARLARLAAAPWPVRARRVGAGV
jgi:hypothetical protein